MAVITRTRTLQHLARRAVLWTLMVALPIYGCAGTLLQVLGPVHRHADIGAADPVDPIRQGFGWLVRQWKDWQDFAHHFAHQQAHEQAHRHDGFERHHHAPNGDIVTLGAQDASADAAGDLGAGAGGGSATLPLALAVNPAILIPTASKRRWSRSGATPWRSVPARRRERPPRPMRRS